MRYIICLALVTSCARAGHGNESPAPAATDAIVGTVQVVGTDSSASINLLPTSANGETYGLPIKLAAPPAMRSVNGLLVRIVGTQASDRRWPGMVKVLSFAVVAVKGQTAVDGMLADDAGALYLVTADGRWHALAQPPAALRTHIGARVWIVGPLDHAPVAYGVIE